MTPKCECTDSGCPGHTVPCVTNAVIVLFRRDMEDETGVWFCDACAEDALDSGVFGFGEEDDSNDEECE